MSRVTVSDSRRRVEAKRQSRDSQMDGFASYEANSCGGFYHDAAPQAHKGTCVPD